MLDFSVHIQPYSYQNECGDFYICEEFEEFYFIAIGDIGGHGSQNVFDTANETKALILENHHLDIAKIFEIIHIQKDIKRVGAVLFIAKIFKNLQILKYGQIGNIKGEFIRERKITELHFQEGILGFNIPQVIKINILKIQKGDMFLITTDGLSIHNSKIQEILGQASTKEIVKFCVDNFSKNNDDELCFVLKYENTTKIDNQFSSVGSSSDFYKNPIEKTREKNKRNFSKDFSTTIIKLEEKNHFVTLKNQYRIKNDLKKILNLCHISLIEHTKFITFITQMLTLRNDFIEVYLSPYKVQFFIVIDKKFLSIVEYLFPQYLFEEIDKENGLIVLEFALKDKFIKSKSLLEELQEELQLGLDSEAYRRYKENQQTQNILSEQAKLASMGEMIGNIAHQWRQPLSVISTASTGLMFQLEYGIELENEILEKTLNKINDNAQYLSKTIDDFRNFLKNENPKESYNLSDIIKQTVTLVSPALADKHIKLVVDEIPETLLEGYPNEIIQSLINIINNAKDAIVEKEKMKYIFIETTFTKNNMVCIEIKDGAGGIPQDIIDKIFEPYFTTKHQAQGTGIGLYMTRQIIVDHNNGTIEVENKSFIYEGIECFGASFKIYLQQA